MALIVNYMMHDFSPATVQGHFFNLHPIGLFLLCITN